MHRTGGIVQQERLAGRLRLLPAYPLDSLIGHRLGEVKVLIRRYAENGVVLNDNWSVLAGLTGEETPEIVESQGVWPAVKGTCGPLFIIRCEVPLAKCRCVVAIETQGLGHGGGTFGPGGVVSRKAIAQLNYRAYADGVIIATRKQRCPRWRTDGVDMKTVVAKTLPG